MGKVDGLCKQCNSPMFYWPSDERMCKHCQQERRQRIEADKAKAVAEAEQIIAGSGGSV